MSDQNAELLEMVKGLTARIKDLEIEVKSLKLAHQQEIPEEVMVAIAAAVSGYLGFRARRRQIHFSRARNWQTQTRESQQAHTPLHLR